MSEVPHVDFRAIMAETAQKAIREEAFLREAIDPTIAWLAYDSIQKAETARKRMGVAEPAPKHVALHTLMELAKNPTGGTELATRVYFATHNQMPGWGVMPHIRTPTLRSDELRSIVDPGNLEKAMKRVGPGKVDAQGKPITAKDALFSVLTEHVEEDLENKKANERWKTPESAQSRESQMPKAWGYSASAAPLPRAGFTAPASAGNRVGHAPQQSWHGR